MRNHTKREHAAPEFWCEECGHEMDDNGEPLRVGFATLALLQAHIRAEHLKCAFCDHQCKGQVELVQHIETLHSGNGPATPKKSSLPCEYEGCDKTFSKRSNLNQHIRNVHQGLRFTCGAVDHSSTPNLIGWDNDKGCAQHFTTKANLENHIRYVHLGHPRPRQGLTSGAGAPGRTLSVATRLTGANRVFTCRAKNCGLAFSRQLDLESHSRFHKPADMPLEPYEAAVASLVDEPAVPEEQQQQLNLRSTADLPFQGTYQPVIQRCDPFMMPPPGLPVPDMAAPGHPQDMGFLSFDQTQVNNQWINEAAGLPGMSGYQSDAIDPALDLNRSG